MTISNKLGWFWKKPLVSTQTFFFLFLFFLQKMIRTYWSKCRVETNGFFQNHPNSLEIVIKWCYRKPFYIVFPPCKVSNPTYMKCLFFLGNPSSVSTVIFGLANLCPWISSSLNLAQVIVCRPACFISRRARTHRHFLLSKGHSMRKL